MCSAEFQGECYRQGCSIVSAPHANEQAPGGVADSGWKLAGAAGSCARWTRADAKKNTQDAHFESEKKMRKKPVECDEGKKSGSEDPDNAEDEKPGC